VPLVFGRRAAGKLGKPGAERAEAGESDNEAHLGDREISGPEKLTSALNAPAGQITAGSRAVSCTESADEVVTGVPGARGQGREIEWAGEVPVNKVSGAPQAHEPGDVWCTGHTASVNGCQRRVQIPGNDNGWATAASGSVVASTLGQKERNNESGGGRTT
jgi:hypothetical protein